MSVNLPRWRFTVGQFERMIDAGVVTKYDRVELLDGELVTMAPKVDRHVFAVFALQQLFGDARERFVLSSQLPIALGDASRPEPDIALLRPSAQRYRGRLPTAEDVLLVGEVAISSLATDRDVKIPLYAREGVREVWLVDLVHDLIRIYREPQPDGYQVIQTARRGETIAPLAFPDWTIAVDDVLPLPGED